MKYKFKLRFLKDKGRKKGTGRKYHKGCLFSESIDAEGNKCGEKWIKKTKMLTAVDLSRGRWYEMWFTQKPVKGNGTEAVRLPYPVEIYDCQQGSTFKRARNTIIETDDFGNELYPVVKVIPPEKIYKSRVRELEKELKKITRERDKYLKFYLEHTP